MVSRSSRKPAPAVRSSLPKPLSNPPRRKTRSRKAISSPRWRLAPISPQANWSACAAVLEPGLERRRQQQAGVPARQRLPPGQARHDSRHDDLVLAGAPGEIGGGDVLQLDAEVEPPPDAGPQRRSVEADAGAGVFPHALADELERPAEAPGAAALAVGDQQRQFRVALEADLVLQFEQAEQFLVVDEAIAVVVELAAQVLGERDVVHPESDHRDPHPRLLAAEQRPGDRLDVGGEIAVDQAAEPLLVHQQQLARRDGRQAGRIPEGGRGVVGHGGEGAAQSQGARAAPALHEGAGELGRGDRAGGEPERGQEQQLAATGRGARNGFNIGHPH